MKVQLHTPTTPKKGQQKATEAAIYLTSDMSYAQNNKQKGF